MLAFKNDLHAPRTSQFPLLPLTPLPLYLSSNCAPLIGFGVASAETKTWPHLSAIKAHIMCALHSVAYTPSPPHCGSHINYGNKNKINSATSLWFSCCFCFCCCFCCVLLIIFVRCCEKLFTFLFSLGHYFCFHFRLFGFIAVFCCRRCRCGWPGFLSLSLSPSLSLCICLSLSLSCCPILFYCLSLC